MTKDILIYIPQVTIPKEEYEHLKAIKDAYIQELETRKKELEQQLLYEKRNMAAQRHLESMFPKPNFSFPFWLW